MRIGISGTQNIGKSTVIKDFMAKWDMYETPEKSYRDVLVEKGLPCNQETTPETQTIILNHLCDQVLMTQRLDNIITDRTPYDALAYSMWAHGKGIKGFDEAFIQGQIALAREASSFYDIIFHIPIVEGHDVKIVDDNLRDTDPDFREEMDNIFSAIFSTYFKQEGPFFKWGDCPAVIELFGSPEERMEMMKLYVNKDGLAYGEEDSLVTDALGDNAGDIVTGEDVPDIIV
jgi:hypothetical protein